MGDGGLHPGGITTGRGLRDFINASSKPPIGGPGINVAGSGKNAVVGATGNQPRRRVVFDAIWGEPHVVGPNQWRYEWAEALKTGDGYDDWTARPNGRDHADEGRGMARNYAEKGNKATGIQGNGTDVDELPEGFSLAPIRPAGKVVRMMEVRLADGSGVEYWINEPNAIQGECPP